MASKSWPSTCVLTLSLLVVVLSGAVGRAQGVCPPGAFTIPDSASTRLDIVPSLAYALLAESVQVSPGRPLVLVGIAGNNINIILQRGDPPQTVRVMIEFDLQNRSSGSTCHVGPFEAFITQQRVIASREDDLCAGFEGTRRLDPGLCDPIVVDLGAPGYLLTNLEDGVLFDIDADGELEQVAWTAPESEDAFLALDRNRNGRIDDGMEIFGDAVSLRSQRIAAHGFEALAEFDLPLQGGNGNGYIEPRDAGYWALRLWTDVNHNGYSEPEELASLFSAGIFAIQLDFEVDGTVDRHGNVLALSSSAYTWFGSGRRIHALSTADVLLQVEELP